jgi:glutathionylspermidine synthase
MQKMNQAKEKVQVKKANTVKKGIQINITKKMMTKANTSKGKYRKNKEIRQKKLEITKLKYNTSKILSK